MTAFDRALAVVLRHEGGFSADPRDAGNWTGGRQGVGKLRGTNMGISAAAFPDVNIEWLTPADAASIYRSRYWSKINGDNLPDPVNLVTFDCAVNCGVDRAAKILQGAAGAGQDGVIGPATILRVCDHDPYDLAAECVARRMQFMASLPAWPTWARGWSRRLVAVAALAARPSPPPGFFNLAAEAPR